MDLLRGLLAWLVFIAAETAHGIVRGLVFAPFASPFLDVLAFALGSFIAFSVAFIFAPFIRSPNAIRWLFVGLSWMVLTFGFEVALGLWGRGYAWDRIWQEFDPTRGGLMGIGLALLLVTPLLAYMLDRYMDRFRMVSRWPTMP